MAMIKSGLERIIGKQSIKLPIDNEKINGNSINIYNFPKYLKKFKTVFYTPEGNIADLKDPKISGMMPEQIRELQWSLLKNQIQFAYQTTPAIYYLWNNVFKITPDEIKSFEDWQNVPPITKEHQRKIGWINFLPTPIANFYLNGVQEGKTIDNIDSNLFITKRKYTGGTSAKEGRDYVLIAIPQSDWNASVDTMQRLLYPIEDVVKNINIAASPYLRVHIAEEIFEDQIGRYGKHVMSRPAGASDNAWIWQIKDIGANCIISSPLDHPLKGVGAEGMIRECGNQFKLALMSSTTPTIELLEKMIEYKIAILNVGGDTGSLPTYFSLAGPADFVHGKKAALNKLQELNTIAIAPSYSEIICPVDLTNSKEGEEGVLLQTNYAGVWIDDLTKEKCLVPALKTQMIRSSATGNLLHVVGTDKFGRPDRFIHQILRYNDFRLNNDLTPKYEEPEVSGGSSRGGCAG